MESLILCDLESHLLKVVAQLSKSCQLSVNLRTARFFDLLLARGASHEGKGNLQGAPPVLEELQHAIRMEDVAASESHTRLFAQLASVADSA